jgi:hypothetical protein
MIYLGAKFRLCAASPRAHSANAPCLLWAFRCDPGRRLRAAVCAPSAVIIFILSQVLPLRSRHRAAFKTLRTNYTAGLSRAKCFVKANGWRKRTAKVKEAAKE